MILLIDDMLTKLLQPTTLTMRWVLHSAAAFEDSPIFCGPSGCLGRAGAAAAATLSRMACRRCLPLQNSSSLLLAREGGRNGRQFWQNSHLLQLGGHPTTQLKLVAKLVIRSGGRPNEIFGLSAILGHRIVSHLTLKLQGIEPIE